MISSVRQWLAARRQEKYNRAFERGFGWVMTDYYYHDYAVDYLWDVLGSSNYSDAFDDGARAALRMLPDDEQ